MSANQAQQKEFPTSHWAHAVAMLIENNKAVAAQADSELSQNSSIDDFDIIRVRRLATQI